LGSASSSDDDVIIETIPLPIESIISNPPNLIINDDEIYTTPGVRPKTEEAMKRLSLHPLFNIILYQIFTQREQQYPGYLQIYREMYAHFHELMKEVESCWQYKTQEFTQYNADFSTLQNTKHIYTTNLGAEESTTRNIAQGEVALVNTIFDFLDKKTGQIQALNRIRDKILQRVSPPDNLLTNIDSLDDMSRQGIKMQTCGMGYLLMVRHSFERMFRQTAEFCVRTTGILDVLIDVATLLTEKERSMLKLEEEKYEALCASILGQTQSYANASDRAKGSIEERLGILHDCLRTPNDPEYKDSLGTSHGFWNAVSVRVWGQTSNARVVENNKLQLFLNCEDVVWAYTMLSQHLLDLYNERHLNALNSSFHEEIFGFSVEEGADRCNEYEKLDVIPSSPMQNICEEAQEVMMDKFSPNPHDILSYQLSILADGAGQHYRNMSRILGKLVRGSAYKWQTMTRVFTGDNSPFTTLNTNDFYHDEGDQAYYTFSQSESEAALINEIIEPLYNRVEQIRIMEGVKNNLRQCTISPNEFDALDPRILEDLSQYNELSLSNLDELIFILHQDLKMNVHSAWYFLTIQSAFDRKNQETKRFCEEKEAGLTVLRDASQRIAQNKGTATNNTQEEELYEKITVSFEEVFDCYEEEMIKARRSLEEMVTSIIWCVKELQEYHGDGYVIMQYFRSSQKKTILEKAETIHSLFKEKDIAWSYARLSSELARQWQDLYSDLFSHEEIYLFPHEEIFGFSADIGEQSCGNILGDDVYRQILESNFSRTVRPEERA
jgi:hypothetical protein